MRLIYIHNAPVPSAAANAVQVVKMCEAFQASGASTTLVVPGDGSSEAREADIAQRYGVPMRFRVRQLPLLRLPGRALLFGACAILAEKKGPNTLIFTRSPSIAWLAVRFGFRTALEAHEPASSFRAGLQSRLKHLFRSPNFTSLIVISDSLRADYDSLFPELSGRILVAHDGADVIADVPTSAPRRLQGSFKVGYVGQLYPGKGMEIIEMLAPLCPWATFHIVGGSVEDISQIKGKMPHARNVIFHGYVPHSETREYLAGMDVVLAPYLRVVHGVGGRTNLANWMSPLKIFEYMAAGKAIICSALPVLREILTNGRNAILVDPDVIDEWVAALTQLQQNHELRARIGAQAKNDFSDFYTWDKRASLIMSALVPRQASTQPMEY